ncbi:hypothetical protein TCDM_10250 [Trypanosoma cruzi Dm28c]|uniref:Uncharacterized protein n=1 Tax=Trypanosoma cruzi Dm28c TaxID=1416333 RepID=V5B812_TRYCR|nr:hypothetical protein TCDM_10250 [Trypanosoma cruzi Dm28c]
MCTTPSCSEQWARRGHASPRSIFPPLKCCVPAQSSKHNQSAHKPNHPPHSLKHIIRMEWHLSTQQQLAAWNLPANPQRDTTTLRSQSGSPSVLPAVHMAGRIPRKHSSGSLAA